MNRFIRFPFTFVTAFCFYLSTLKEKLLTWTISQGREQAHLNISDTRCTRIDHKISTHTNVFTRKDDEAERIG